MAITDVRFGTPRGITVKRIEKSVAMTSCQRLAKHIMLGNRNELQLIMFLTLNNISICNTRIGITPQWTARTCYLNID